jgi:hypothetical protein
MVNGTTPSSQENRCIDHVIFAQFLRAELARRLGRFLLSSLLSSVGSMPLLGGESHA